MRPLVLASASPARLRLLQHAGFSPVVMVSDVDEDAIVAAMPPTAATADVVRVLAEAKAAAVAERAPEDALVLGCDSMLRLGGETLGKPASEAEAFDRWVAMRGRTGDLMTGHCLVDTRVDGCVSDVATTTVRFGTPSDDELRAYVASGEPMHVAGAFTLDGRSAPFVDGIDGDHGNVIGLSLPLFRRLLRELGIEVTSLWP